MQDIEGKVKEIISENLGIGLGRVADQAKIIDDLGADSLDVVELTSVLEKEYNIEIPDKDIKKLTSVNAVVEYIKGHNSGIDERRKSENKRYKRDIHSNRYVG